MYSYNFSKESALRKVCWVFLPLFLTGRIKLVIFICPYTDR